MALTENEVKRDVWNGIKDIKDMESVCSMSFSMSKICMQKFVCKNLYAYICMHIFACIYLHSYIGIGTHKMY